MYIKVKVFADQNKESFAVVGENRYEARVKVSAERNVANNRVLELVSRHFRLPIKAVRIVHGHQRPSKILSVPDPS